jgi:hypothetical protein
VFPTQATYQSDALFWRGILCRIDFGCFFLESEVGSSLRFAVVSNRRATSRAARSASSGGSSSASGFSTSSSDWRVICYPYGCKAATVFDDTFSPRASSARLETEQPDAKGRFTTEPQRTPRKRCTRFARSAHFDRIPIAHRVDSTGGTVRPSWPGLTRPSAHDRRCVDGRVRPGHDDQEGPKRSFDEAADLSALCVSVVSLAGRFLVRGLRRQAWALQSG